MKRILIGLTFLAALGLAMAGPPVDYQIACLFEDEDAVVVGVASVVDGQLHLALHAELACDGEIAIVDGEGTPLATLTWDEVDGWTIDEWLDEETAAPELASVVEVPWVAIEGMLGAQRNRAAAMERRAFGQAQAVERGLGIRPDVLDDEDEVEIEIEDEDEDDDGPPVVLPGPAGDRRP